MRFTIPLATITVAVLAASAAADSNVEVYLDIRPQPGTAAPQIEGTIVGGPRVPVDQIHLVDERHVSIPATSLREFKDGPDTLSVAFVIAGSEYMMGNDDIVPDEDPSRFFGYNKALRKALEELDLAHAMPSGSQAELVTFADRAQVRLPMGPIAKLDQFALGIQLDYFHQVGTDMVDAIQIALADLSKVRTGHKVLIVIGDGNDTNNELAQTTLATLKKSAAREGIQTFAVIYKSALSDEHSVIQRMIPASQTVASPEGIVASLKSIFSRISDRYTVTFPGDQLQWDGRSQELVVRIRYDETDSVTLVLPDRGEGASPQRSWFGSFWFQLLIGLGSVGVIVLLLRWRGARNAI